MIPLSKPDIGPDEEQAVLDVLRSGMLAMGRRTTEFEEAWAAYCGVRHAVLMANGTLALEALLRGLGIGPGDEVVTVSFTFNATVSTILQAGARPVFVDVRADDFCIDPDRVEAAITPRTKAIMPVHLYGLMADMAPAGGARRAARAGDHRGRRAGPRRHLSRPPRRPVRPRDVQPVCDEEPDDRRGRLRDDRRRRARRPPAAVPQPRDARPLPPRGARDELQAHGPRRGAGARTAGPPRRAHGAPRRRNAARLTEGLDGYLTPRVPAAASTSGTSTRCASRANATASLDGARRRGIGTLVYYPVPVHRQAYLQAFVPGAADLDLPVTDRLADEVLSIPVRPNLTDESSDAMIDAVREVAAPRSDRSRPSRGPAS